MKKLSIILGLLLFCSQACFAVDAVPEQVQEVIDTKAAIAVQKQPNYDHNQKQEVKNNWFCIVIQVNGKVKDSSNTDN